MTAATAEKTAKKPKAAPGSRLLVDRKALADALAEASGVVPSKSPKPILQNVVLAADPENGSELLATNLEIGLRVRVLGVRAEAAGRVVLEPRRLQQILRTTNDDELAIDVDGETVEVRGSKAKFKLATEDPTLFPDVLGFDAGTYLAVSAADLARAIDRTVFATDVESTRYALGGVLFEAGSAELALVATDGRRLARLVITAETEGEFKPPARATVVPVKALKTLRKLLRPDAPPVHVALTTERALFRTDDATLVCRLVEGRFPNYQDVFPTEKNATVTCPAGMLSLAFAQAAITTSEESRGIDCVFGPERTELTSQAADMGSSRVEIMPQVQGGPVEITFDGRYVAQGLDAIDDEAEVRLELVDGKNAAAFKTDDGRYQYIVMPLTRDR